MLKHVGSKSLRMAWTAVVCLAVQMAVVHAQAPPTKSPAKTAPQAGGPKLKAIFEPVNYKQDLKLTDVHFVNDETGFVTGANGTILRTTDGGATWVYNRYRREAMAFKKLYPESHFSVYDFVRLTITNIFSDLWHAARERVLLKNLASIFWFRLMQLHGTRMGHRETTLVTPQLPETFYYARERKKMEERGREV